MQHIHIMTILHDEGRNIMGEEGTETTALEDGTKAGVEDLTEKIVEDTTDIDKAGKEKAGALSDDDKAGIKTIKGLLDEYEISSPEELKTFVAKLATLKDDVGDANLEELKEHSALLKRYQKVWAEDKEKEREDNETPEETIARLKKEKLEERRKFKEQEAEQEKFQENKRALTFFTNTVKSTIKAQEDLPAAYHNHLTEFLGIENEIHEIDLEDKTAIKRITKSAAKKIMAFEQDVIKRYIKGKAKVVKMTTSSDSTPPETKKVKTLKEARGILKSRLDKIFK